MSAEIVEIGCITKLDLPPERVLNSASSAELQDVVIVGYDKEGEFYFAASQASGSDVLWLLELAKHKLIKIGLQEE